MTEPSAKYIVHSSAPRKTPPARPPRWYCPKCHNKNANEFSLDVIAYTVNILRCANCATTWQVRIMFEEFPPKKRPSEDDIPTDYVGDPGCSACGNPLEDDGECLACGHGCTKTYAITVDF